MTELELGTEEERAELISICEAASVPQRSWYDRDSHGAQSGVGVLWALLRAGCNFRIHPVGNPNEPHPLDDPPSTDKTIWVTTWAEGFAYFEDGERKRELHYLPTRARLALADGKDWY